MQAVIYSREDCKFNIIPLEQHTCNNRHNIKRNISNHWTLMAACRDVATAKKRIETFVQLENYIVSGDNIERYPMTDIDNKPRWVYEVAPNTGLVISNVLMPCQYKDIDKTPLMQVILTPSGLTFYSLRTKEPNLEWFEPIETIVPKQYPGSKLFDKVREVLDVHFPNLPLFIAKGTNDSVHVTITPRPIVPR